MTTLHFDKDSFRWDGFDFDKWLWGVISKAEAKKEWRAIKKMVLEENKKENPNYKEIEIRLHNFKQRYGRPMGNKI